MENFTTPQDDSQPIDVSTEYNLHYWALKLGVTPERLQDAVSVVGTGLDDLRSYLGG